MGTATLKGFKDAHVYASHPDRSFNQHTYSVVQDGAALAYIGMNSRPYPRGATILSAKLVMFSVDNYTSGSVQIQVGQLAERRDFDRMTWNDRPDLLTGTSVSVTKNNPTALTRWEWDITDFAQALSDGAPNYGLRIRSYGTERVRFFSVDAGAVDYRPFMTFEWADNPDAPSVLSPSANRAVSIAKPVLRCDFTDVSGDTSLAAIQVQIHTSNTWTSPSWDSGEVATTVPELDLNTTSYPGITAGTSRWWRVRVKDGAGLWSAWSDGAQFSRVAKPTVSITYPTDGGTTEQPSPIITWTTTNQVAYHVAVYTAEGAVPDGSTVLYSSGKIASTSARTHEVPVGVLAQDDEDYVVRVRVWDNVARESTPGDPVFIQDVHTTTFDRDGSLTPVTALVGTPTLDEVGMTLTWSRSTTPGEFAIIRDGRVVTTLAPADVSTGGTAYAWTDYRATPRRPHVWEVAPVVNGDAGKGGPTVTDTLEPEGVWLVHRQSGDRVRFENEDLGSWSMPEQSTSHTPLGGRRPVLITQGMGGYHGTITGSLLDERDGPTAQEKRDVLLELKANPGRTHWLVLQDQNIPVTTWNISVTPAPVGDDVGFVASFEFAQVSEFDYTPPGA